MNVERINEVIEYLRKDQGVHFKMDTWAQYLDDQLYKSEDDKYYKSVREVVECGTAFCLGGLLYFQDQLAKGKKAKEISFVGIDYERYVGLGAEQFGIEGWKASALFFMHSDEDAREAFDKLPGQQRAEIAIKVLEHLRDTGEVDWLKFLPEDIRSDEDDYEDDDY